MSLDLFQQLLSVTFQQVLWQIFLKPDVFTINVCRSGRFHNVLKNCICWSPHNQVLPYFPYAIDSYLEDSSQQWLICDVFSTHTASSLYLHRCCCGISCSSSRLPFFYFTGLLTRNCSAQGTSLGAARRGLGRPRPVPSWFAFVIFSHCTVVFIWKNNCIRDWDQNLTSAGLENCDQNSGRHIVMRGFLPLSLTRITSLGP